MSRQRILSQIETERQCQETRWTAAKDDGHSHNDWVAILTRQAGLAAQDGTVDFDPVRFRRQMLRTAAVAIAAIEAQDRKSGLAAALAQFAPTPESGNR